MITIHNWRSLDRSLYWQTRDGEQLRIRRTTRTPRSVREENGKRLTSFAIRKLRQIHWFTPPRRSNNRKYIAPGTGAEPHKSICTKVHYSEPMESCWMVTILCISQRKKVMKRRRGENLYCLEDLADGGTGRATHDWNSWSNHKSGDNYKGA